MTCKGEQSGKVDIDPSDAGRVGIGVEFSFVDVEERLTEALRHWWRTPDGDARYSLGGRISSVWRQVLPGEHLADLIDARGQEMETPTPKALPLSRADMRRRDEATEWLLLVPERDRRLVIVALSHLARGQSQVPWLKVARQLRTIGAEGLRKRYSRAITGVCHRLNGGKAH